MANPFAQMAESMNLKDEGTYAGGEEDMGGMESPMGEEVPMEEGDAALGISIPVSADPRLAEVQSGDTVILTVKEKDDSAISFDIQEIVSGSQEGSEGTEEVMPETPEEVV